ncbi:tautomerase family protein [Enterococcus plantarum]|uniref:tautomerase family protein n=1 Tax=Enterococcus plantarum TaxID=1077675 RepID=UPI001A8E6284|nr:tautomerase family protein [Enterococcus plantarum]MBO0466344.1 tautomerase family protein [Enterococcus plantarum]
MPLLKFDLVEGRSKEEIQTILDIAHSVVLASFDVPTGDRYQIVTQHKPFEMVLEDTGLGFNRDPAKMISLTVISRQRTTAQKEKFYRSLAQQLYELCGIAPKNLLVSFVINDDADWSFGFGEAQFLTGKL